LCETIEAAVQVNGSRGGGGRCEADEAAVREAALAIPTSSD
jgi:hypothetical protein